MQRSRCNNPQLIACAICRFDLINLGIGIILGAGVFVTTGTVANSYAGCVSGVPGLLLSFRDVCEAEVGASEAAGSCARSPVPPTAAVQGFGILSHMAGGTTMQGRHNHLICYCWPFSDTDGALLLRICRRLS